MYFNAEGDGSEAAACVSGESEILTSFQGETKKANMLLVGDSVVCHDFSTDEEKLGRVTKIHVHKKATSFVTYGFDDGSFLEVTDYHPLYAKEGWKSFTRKNGYEKPQINDEVKTAKAWKKLTKIEEWKGLEDFYDFEVRADDGSLIGNYYANNTLVQSSI